MDILKWYSIILIGLGALSNLFLWVRGKGITKFISFILFTPIFIYLILN